MSETIIRLIPWRRLRVRLAVWKLQLLRGRYAQIVATFPATGFRSIRVDFHWNVLDDLPLVGLGLTRGGSMLHIGGDGVIEEEEDNLVLQYPSGEVEWSCDEVYPSRRAFDLDMQQRRLSLARATEP